MMNYNIVEMEDMNIFKNDKMKPLFIVLSLGPTVVNLKTHTYF